MKCTNRFLSLVLCLLLVLSITGCGNTKYEYSYEEGSVLTNFHIHDMNVENRMIPFADSLCVTDENVIASNVNTEASTGALLFDLKNKDVLYAKNIHEKLHPASLTKIMTALVAMENGTLDMVLTATNNTLVNASGAQVCGLKAGDQMTLEQALNVLLVYSANDAALLIAEGIGGNIANFVDMMNVKAKSIGATNTHFSNPHGLTEDDHLTTAYDLYLMFNEAIKNEKFTEILQKSNYSTIYSDKNGNNRELSLSTTNKYISGSAKSPENITIIGGKTGSTKAAGSCLILLAKDINGNSYISEILQSDNTDILYQEMSELLGEITK